ncbi:Ig-like domain-containing protein [Enterovirga sp. GCM10030262]|uniref:Ig-like domain-containing protein n=1 Tax=Enterovirga sp. GCM10030262 TaxID=3273391 RepID=UPI00361063D1
MARSIVQRMTGDESIDGLLSGTRWVGTVTIGFPDSPDDYPAGYADEPRTDFFAVSAEQQRVIGEAVDMIESYTNLSFKLVGSRYADIAIAQSSMPETAYAAYPGEGRGGDIWFGSTNNYRTPKIGDYSYLTHLHEFGHALGLKHPHEGTALPSSEDWLGSTVMSYRSHIGAPTTGYINETFGYPTTFMMNDILALQTMYGADYTTEAGDTVYTWSPINGQQFINGVGQAIPGSGVGGVFDGSANRIFMTVWDGGGNDTYDLSLSTENVSIDLDPGQGSIFSQVQRPNLGNGRYGLNVYNAHLFEGDERSLIENAVGGISNDSLRGNQAANRLTGGDGDDYLSGRAGNDRLVGGAGNDTIIGGAGADTAVFDFDYRDALLIFQDNGELSIGTAGAIDTVQAVEFLRFNDRLVRVTDIAPPDDVAPQLSGFDDNQVYVYQHNLNISFNEYVELGEGEVRLFYSDGTLFQTYTLDDFNSTETGGYFNIIISDFEGNFYFEIDAGIVVDAAGNAFEGLYGPNTWNFTVGPVDDYPAYPPTSVLVTPDGPAVDGYINDSNDVDYLALSLTAGQLYEIEVEAHGPNGASGLTYDLYDNINDYYGYTFLARGGEAAPIHYLADRTGTYYFKVDGDGAGDYAVSARTLADDFAGDASTIGRLRADGPAVDGILHNDDRDWLKIDLVAGETYRFNIRSGSSAWPDGGAPALFASLRDESGIYSGGTGLETDEGQFVVTATTSGIHYLEFGNGGSYLRETGSYSVEVERGAFSPPTLVAMTPTPGSTGVHPGADIVLTFSEAIQAGGGDILLYTGGPTPMRIDVNDDSQVTIDGSTLIIDPTNDLRAGSVRIDLEPGAIQDLDGTHLILSSDSIAGSANSFGEAGLDGDSLIIEIGDGRDDYGETIATIGSIADGGTVTGEVGSYLDSDWFKMSLIGGQTYDLRLINGDGRAPHDAFSNSRLAVRDGAGTLLVEDALNSGGGANSRLFFTAPTSGDYFIEVRGEYAGTSFGYRLEARRPAPTEGADNIVMGGGGDAIAGEGGDDRLDGGAGNDHLSGGFGDDVLIGGDGDDMLDGGEGIDRIIGGAGTDTLTYAAAAAAMTLDLAAGIARPIGGTGTERLSSIENVIGSSGSDKVIGSDRANRVEGGAGNDNLNGMAGNDVLFGGTGNDALNGGGGDDRMVGGHGDDVYSVRDDSDAVIEGAGLGSDSVRAFLDYVLGEHVETLRLYGGALNGTGNALHNLIVGNSGDNVLEGLGGADRISGGSGTDSLSGGIGRDRLYGGLGNDLLTGEGGDDHLNGDQGVDSLDGGNGLDRLAGGDGADILAGGDGDDSLIGGAQRDTMTGGAGADMFIFSDGDSDALRGQADRILDFRRVDDDQINLRQIDADVNRGGNQAFSFVGRDAFSDTAGELRLLTANGFTYVEGDVDGDGRADFSIRLDGEKALLAFDFIL